MSRSRIAVAAAALAVAAAVAGPGSALPAQAATCYRDTCTKVDPQTAGCSADAKDLQDVTANNVRVVLRYSPTCDAAWVRYSFNNRGPGAGDIAIQRYITTPYGTAFWGTVSTESTAYNYSGWTDMQGGTAANTYKIRGKLYTQGGASTGYYYTPTSSI